jgi:uracil-DNA glycosylase
MSAWTDHVERWKDCTACGLCQQRDRIVLARGQVPADVVFVGEAPGASEDALGLPFVGPAGKLLDQIIERSLPTGTRYALTNLVACFPREAKDRGENEPEVAEILSCRPRLLDFIQLCRPKLVVRVGRLASDFLEHDAYGKVCGAQVVDIVHPAAVLRMPLAQKGMVVQRAIVQIRCAIADALQCVQTTGEQ